MRTFEFKTARFPRPTLQRKFSDRDEITLFLLRYSALRTNNFKLSKRHNTTESQQTRLSDGTIFYALCGEYFTRDA